MLFEIFGACTFLTARFAAGRLSSVCIQIEEYSNKNEGMATPIDPGVGYSTVSWSSYILCLLVRHSDWNNQHPRPWCDIGPNICILQGVVRLNCPL